MSWAVCNSAGSNTSVTRDPCAKVTSRCRRPPGAISAAVCSLSCRPSRARSGLLDRGHSHARRVGWTDSGGNQGRKVRVSPKRCTSPSAPVPMTSSAATYTPGRLKGSSFKGISRFHSTLERGISAGTASLTARVGGPSRSVSPAVTAAISDRVAIGVDDSSRRTCRAVICWSARLRRRPLKRSVRPGCGFSGRMLVRLISMLSSTGRDCAAAGPLIRGRSSARTAVRTRITRYRRAFPWPWRPAGARRGRPTGRTHRRGRPTPRRRPRCRRRTALRVRSA